MLVWELGDINKEKAIIALKEITFYNMENGSLFMLLQNNFLSILNFLSNKIISDDKMEENLRALRCIHAVLNIMRYTGSVDAYISKVRFVLSWFDIIILDDRFYSICFLLI